MSAQGHDSTPRPDSALQVLKMIAAESTPEGKSVMFSRLMLQRRLPVAELLNALDELHAAGYIEPAVGIPNFHRVSMRLTERAAEVLGSGPVEGSGN